MKPRLLVAAVSLLMGACTADTTDTAPTSTTAVVDATRSSTTAQPDEPFIERETTLTSNTIISNDRPIRILIGTKCAQQTGSISLWLRHSNSDSITDFVLRQQYFGRLDREELRIWVPNIAPPGDYRLVVNCSYTDLMQPQLSATLTKADPAEPEPTAPDSVMVEDRTVTAVATVDIVDGRADQLAIVVGPPDSATLIDVNVFLGFGELTRAQVKIELPAFVTDGPYEAKVLGPFDGEQNILTQTQFDLTTAAAED